MFAQKVVDTVNRAADRVGGWRLCLFAGALAGAGVGLAVSLSASGHSVGPPVPVAALSVLAFLAERRSVRVGARAEVSVSFLPIVFAAVVFGPLAAMLVGSIGLLSMLGSPYIRWFVWTSSRALVAASAGMVAWTVGSPGSDQFQTLVTAAALAACAEGVADLALACITAAVRGTVTPRSVIRTHGPMLFGSAALYTPIIGVLAFAYAQSSVWSILLFVVPAFAAQRLFMLYREQRETSDELVAVNARLEKANLSFAAALVATLDARDRYTAGHSAAVAVYARDIARRMGLTDEEQQLAHLAGLVHDIGKIGLPGGLLEKQGPLTLQERRQMEQHSIIAERILRNVDDYAEIAEIVRHHHERVDGLGYPDGLHSDDIPVISRIIAVADAYDAMTSDRPYRDAMPSRVARLRLAQAVDSQFDTSVVAAFEAILAGASEEYRSGRRSDFTFASQEAVVADVGVATAG